MICGFLTYCKPNPRLFISFPLGFGNIPIAFPDMETSNY